MASAIKSDEIQGIEIANPLYDTVFKHLMANNRVATDFIETLLPYNSKRHKQSTWLVYPNPVRFR
jgi:hypothetical protein